MLKHRHSSKYEKDWSLYFNDDILYNQQRTEALMVNF